MAEFHPQKEIPGDVMLEEHKALRNNWINKYLLRGQSNYAGASPAGNPKTLLKKNVTLLPLDGGNDVYGGFQHDADYFSKGASGALGAFFNTKVTSYDKQLIQGAKTIMSNAINKDVYIAARNMKIFFQIAVEYKTHLTNYDYYRGCYGF